MATKYKIGEICIDSDGLWWVQFWGTHADQGGPCFTDGNMGMDELDTLLALTARNMTKHKQDYLDAIAELEPT